MFVDFELHVDSPIPVSDAIHTSILEGEAILCAQARQTRPNSGGVAEGHLRFDKGGGGCNNFLLFTR